MAKRTAPTAVATYVLRNELRWGILGRGHDGVLQRESRRRCRRLHHVSHSRPSVYCTEYSIYERTIALNLRWHANISCICRCGGGPGTCPTEAAARAHLRKRDPQHMNLLEFVYTPKTPGVNSNMQLCPYWSHIDNVLFYFYQSNLFEKYHGIAKSN